MGEGVPMFSGDLTSRLRGDGVRLDVLDCLGDNLGDGLRHLRGVSFIPYSFGLKIEDSSVSVVSRARDADSDVISDVTDSEVDDVMDDVARADVIVVMVKDVTGWNDNVAVVILGDDSGTDAIVDVNNTVGVATGSGITNGDVTRCDVTRGDVMDVDNTGGKDEQHARVAEKALVEI